MTVNELYQFADQHGLLDAELYFPKYEEDDELLYDMVKNVVGRVSTSDGKTGNLPKIVKLFL